MRILFWFISLCLVAGLLSFVVALWLKYLNKNWWQKKVVKRLPWWLIIWGALSLAVWIAGLLNEANLIATIGATSAVLMMTVALGLIISLPLSGIFNYFARRENNGSDKRSVNLNRRRFLQATAAVIPVASTAMAGKGLVEAHTDTIIETVPIQFENLPFDLEGFKILHLSDAHLGIYKQLEDLENIVSRAAEKKPDLVLFTGDIADELSLLPDALKIVKSINPTYGAFASLGNHEYYRGIREVLRVFDTGEVPLLKGNGVNLKVGQANLFVAGADDPRQMGQSNFGFLNKSISDALDGSPESSFKIVMSHRPEALDPAAELGIDLTLAGHTHGGQVGVGKHSLFSIFSPDSYLRGHYQKEKSQMFVSSGIGHWFPFRLGCPSEAPIIQLVSKKQPRDS